VQTHQSLAPNFPIHKLFERSCELGLWRLTAHKISEIFGQRLHRKMSGKLATVIDQIEHGHYVYRAYFKHAVLKQYEKFSTFLRNQLCSSNFKDFGLRKGLDNLEGTSRKRRYGYDVQPHPRRSRNLSSWLDQGSRVIAHSAALAR
jgi:hypothetical protein